MVFQFKQGTTKEEICNLGKTPGFCISIDIAGSTSMKKISCKAEWMAKIKNSFQISNSYNDVEWEFIKGIGDEWMFYCPNCDQKENSSETKAVNSLNRLKNIIEMSAFEKVYFKELVGTICYCKEAYNISFAPLFSKKQGLEYPEDYYGLDIDRTFRIAAGAKREFKNKCKKEDKEYNGNLIIMDKSFYDICKKEYKKNNSGHKEQFNNYLKQPLYENGSKHEWRLGRKTFEKEISDFPNETIYYLILMEKGNSNEY